ncbi:PREDICTED: sperm-associated antigen 5 isoform X2 [Myotis brandtii]|uniref:sperm-associated antigen 5 isoform X2 n=1 Tax=Myotis brandtii TaxID=109478 RepID=UPI000703E626|nr:PREDICTED: sperm-associated antigen 5 isoform X2 [Myotis brandtii]
MWRVKQLSLSPSPQPGEPPVRTPLRELNLQPEALTSSAKGPGICYSLTPSLCKLGLQEGSNNLSPLDFENAKMTDSPSEQFSHPSKWLEACQHESDEQPLNLIPQNNSTPKTSEEAVDPVENNAVKTMVLVPSAGGQQQDITLEAHLNTIAETNSFSLDEPLRPGDLLRNGVEPCMKDSFSEVVPAMPEKLTFQDPPAHLLEYPPNPCSEQQLPCSEESPRDSKTETVPEDLVSSESNAFLPSSMRCLPPSTAFPADFPVSHVDSGQEIVEHRAIEEREVSFSILPEEAELRDQTLVSNTQDIPSTCLTPNPGEMESQAAPGPAVEDAGRILISDTGPWMSPLAWLEKGVNTSVMLENLRQSLSLPSALQDAATGTAPSSTCSVGTWFTPPAPPQEKSTNTSQTGLLGTKDSASEREHLLWGNHPPDLTALSRRDLEDNLMNSLLILEVLSRPLRNWKSQLTTPHPEVQDSSTQTDTADTSRSGINKKLEHLHGNREIGQTLQQTRNVMSWVLVSKELISLLYLSLLHLEEDKTTVSQESRRTETLVSCCFDVLKKLRARLQSLKTEREEAKHGEEMALRGKDAAESVLEAFCAHASQRISQLQQNLASMGEFRGLLKETQTQLVGFHTEQEEVAQETASFTSILQQDWMSMQQDYITWTALLSRSRELTEKLTAKSRQTLQERDAAVEEKQQVSRELEQVSAQLEDCKGQIEQLELENSRLATDLRAQLQMLASMQSQLQELQSQHAHCTRDLAMKDELLCQLTQSNEKQATQWQKEEMTLKHIQAELQQQHAVLAKEVQDLKETLEFADQENQVAHLELGQVECQLKSTLEVLRERSLQCEDLKDTVENLKDKLASTVAENQEKDLEKTRQYSQELRVLTEQLQNLTFFLHTKLKETQSWVLVSKELISLLYLSLLHLEEDKTTVSQESRRTETLVSCCFDVLKKLRARLQSLKTEREEAKHGEEMALRGKDAAESVLEAFCAHASQRISQLQQNLASMGEFRGLLKETQTQLVGFHTEQEEVAQETASFTSILQQDWMSMQQDYITWTALLSRSRELTEKLTAKSRQTLQERDAAVEEKQQVSRELEQVSAQLEDCKGQIEQLELENSRLATDLRAQLQMLASMQSQLQELQSQHAHCTRDLAMKDELLCQLTQSNEKQATQWQKEEMTLKHIQAELQQQHAVLAKEVQDLKETLEFADQENQVAHLELGQVECQLKSTLEVLRERSLQCEDLKDTVENLKDKLASTVAENQEKDLEKTRQYSQELRVLTEQLQNLTFFLHTKLKETAEPETLLKSTACASAQEHPPSTDSTFLGSILTAMADKEPESAPVALLGSDKSAFTRVASMVSPQPTETPGMEKSLEEMSTMTLELQSLCSLLQESKEEAVRTLQRKICDLQARLQAQEEQHQEAQKAKEADIEKLNQALCLRYKNEKELQEVIQQQNEKILEQIDKSGELISLREEVTQLTRSLRRAETETKVLQETLAGQLDPNCQPMATNWIQEKVWLSQEVDKLRVMFLEMKNEKEKLMVKFQSHRNILEENLRRSDKELKKLDDIVQHIYETLLSIPEVVRGCKELQELLEFLS